MQRISDLHEIVTALEEIGNKWYDDERQLREENNRLLNENMRLREEIDKLRKESESLDKEMQNLLERMETLKEKLHDDIVKDIDPRGREDFRKDVTASLKAISDRLTATPYQSEPTDKASEPAQEVPDYMKEGF